MNINQLLKSSQIRPNFLLSVYLELSGIHTLYTAYMLHKQQQQRRFKQQLQQEQITRLPC